MLVRTIGYSDTAILTADGCVSEVGALTSEGCCPIEPCMVDACTLMCSFVSLLPNGPLWDRAKVERMQRYANDPCGPACLPSPGECASVVDYAIYSGYQLDYLIKGPLWSALREASPETAVETLDSWLQMYGWVDSWESVCRDRRLGPSPFECGIIDPPLDACDANFSPIYVPEIPLQLDLAVKRGIVRALSRLQMSPIKNLCGINWVIEPLGAFLRPAEAVGECCTDVRWEICNLADTLESVPPKHCVSGQNTSQIQAWFPMQSLVFNPATGQCEPTGEATLHIWPGILAAQIIALSLMPTARDCSQFISRCPELGDAVFLNCPYEVAGASTATRTLIETAFDNNIQYDEWEIAAPGPGDAFVAFNLPGWAILQAAQGDLLHSTVRFEVVSGIDDVAWCSMNGFDATAAHAYLADGPTQVVAPTGDLTVVRSYERVSTSPLTERASGWFGIGVVAGATIRLRINYCETTVSEQ